MEGGESRMDLEFVGSSYIVALDALMLMMMLVCVILDMRVHQLHHGWGSRFIFLPFMIYILPDDFVDVIVRVI